MRIEDFSEEVNKMSSEGINLLPVMSLLVLLIPFLIITTVFVETSVFELYLPSGKKSVKPLAKKEVKKKNETLFVYLEKAGIRTGVNQKRSEYITIHRLKRELKKIKKIYPDKDDIIIVSEAKIRYQEIIDVIDICVSTNFSKVSMAAKHERRH